MNYKLIKLCELVGGELAGDGEVEIVSAAPIETAAAGQITFLANRRYEKYLMTTAAEAVVLPFDIAFDRRPQIRHKNPYYAFALILDALYPEEPRLAEGINTTAVIAKTAIVGNDCSVGALTHVGERARIGAQSYIFPGVYIGRDASVGRNCRIYPGVVILDGCHLGDNVIIHAGTVIGSDGFGYARHEQGIKKIKQIGWVEISDDVEIGANCTIDRGALGPTRIGRGTKIDNLVQIAHNVEIGENCIIVSQVGISGSTKLGKGVILGGQVGLVGHIELGDGVSVGAQSGISKSIPPGKVYFGYPAREISVTKRIEACLSRLPDLFRRVQKLEENK